MEPVPVLIPGMRISVPAGEPTTRERVLGRLRQGPATVDELAAYVELTPNAVRLHLGRLERDGEVARVGVRHAASAGKPPQLYRATSRAEERLSRAYPLAFAALARTLAARLAPARVRSLFAAAGRGAATGAKPAHIDALETARALLESLGAIVSVEKTRGHAPVVNGAACPLAVAVRQCPEACELVRAMLAEATSARVTTCCEHGPEPKCRFSIAVP